MSRSSLSRELVALTRARMSWAALAGGIALVALACGEQPAEPKPLLPGDIPSVAKLDCVVDVVARNLACVSNEGGGGATLSRSLVPGQTGSATTDLIVGGQNTYVKLTGGAATWDNVVGGAYTFPVTVQNLVPQALGTTDSATVANGGVRVFFITDPHVTGGTGTITVTNADGTGTFTGSGQKYFQYPEILQPNATSASHSWVFDVSAGVTTFAFQVYVSAPVQYPTGWVVMSATGAALPLLRPGQTSTFSGAVKDQLGRAVSGQTVTWSSGTPATATIDPSTGVMTAVAEGTTVITGTSGTRGGNVRVNVVQPNAANSTIAAVPVTVTSGTSVPVTVQVRTNANANFPFDGDAVVLSASNGGTTGPVVDNHDGTYSSTVTTTGVGAVVVSGTLNGTAIGTSDTVTFAVGALHHFLVEQAAGGAIPQQSNGPFDIRIVAQDVNGNTVPGFTGTVNVTSTGTLTQGGGTTAAFVGGVLATRTVQISNDGLFTITATRSTGGTESGTSTSFRVDLAPTVASTTPVNGASGVSPGAAISVTFSKSMNATMSSFSLSCAGTGAAAYTLSASPATTFTLTPNSALPGGATCTLTVNAAQITSTFATPMAADLVRTFTTSLTASGDSYPEAIVGNVAVSSANTTTPFNVTTNDAVDGSTTLALVGGGTITAGQQTVTTTAGSLVTLTVSGPNRGFFTLDPAPGLRGNETFQYQLVGPSLSSSAATVTVPISAGAMVWFVDLGAPACTTLAAGCGRLSHPFSTLAAFQAVNDNGVGHARQGDAIFLYQNATSYVGPVTLLANQKLIGQGVSASLASISGVTPTLSAAAFPATTAGAPTSIAGGPGDVILASAASGTRTIRGLSLGTTTAGGIALASDSTATFGTLDIAEVPIVNTNGTAIHITGGTLAATFTTLSASGGTRGVSLTSVVGSGPVALGTGALSATTGDALRLSGSSGTYTYAGTLAGGTTGSAVTVIGGSASATLGGNLSQANASSIVSVSGGHTGTLTFNGTVVPAAGTGLQFDDADGSYAFNGTTTLTAAPMTAGIRIANGSAGTFGFTGLTAITMNGAAEIPLDVDGGTSVGASNVNPTITIPAPLTNNVGRVVRIQGMSGGGVTLSGNLTSAGIGASGILASNNSGGSITFSGASKSFNTRANNAVTLSSNAGASIAFTGTLTIATTSGTGFDASGGGTVSVADASTPANLIIATTGAALRVENTTIGAGNITFRSLSSGNATGSVGYGIALHNTGTAGGLRVLGNLTNARDGSGGTIQHRTGATSTAVCSAPGNPLTGTGIHLLGTSNVVLASMNLHDFDSYGIVGYSVSGFTMRGTIINGTNGTNAAADNDAVRFCNLTGTALMDSVLIAGGANDGLHVTNDAGVLNRLVVQNGSSIGGTATGNDAVTLESRANATMNVTVTGSTLTGARGDMFQLASNDQSVTDLMFAGNTVDNGVPQASILPAGGGMALSYDGGGRSTTTVNTFQVDTNSFRGANGIALNVVKLNGKGTVTGKVIGNTIGVTGVTSSGSLQSGGIQVQHAGSGTVTARIESNTIRQYFGDAGIMIGAGDADPDGAVAAPVFNLTLNGNVTKEPGTGAYGGIFADLGSQPGDTHQVCLATGTTVANDVGGGGIGGSPSSDFTLLRNVAGVTVKLPGYTGAPHSPTTVFSYLLPRNGIANGSENGSIIDGTASGVGFTNTPGGAVCPTVP